MSPETEKSTTDLISAFTDKNVASDVKDAKLVSPLNNVGSAMLDFFKVRIDEIIKDEEFKNEVKQALRMRLTDPNVTFSQLSSLFANISEKTTNASESFISLFRSTPNSTNPFTSNMNKDQSSSNLDKVINNMSPEDQSALEKLFRLMKTFDKNNSPE